MVKSLLRSNPYTLLCIDIYHLLLSKVHVKLFSDKRAVNRFYKKHTGKYPDLVNPKTFSEKQQWYKLFYRDPKMETCADKIDVRTYVELKGYGKNLNTVLTIVNNIKELDINSLPEKFVVKAAHGSGKNLIVTNKDEIKWSIWKRIFKIWMKQEIYWSGREWVYKNLKGRLIVEKYLEDESGSLTDYKFFCFNGKLEFVQLDYGRYGESQVRNFYDMNWCLIPFGKDIPHSPEFKFNRPDQFDKMKEIATVLCKDFNFVRVDLYQSNSKVYFGELTFFPASGAPDFVPVEYDTIVGNMWKID